MKSTIPFTVGVEIDNGGFLPLIVKNSPLPVRITRLFTPLSAVQQAVEIHVLKGDHRNASRNSTLGRFLMPSETQEIHTPNPKIEVTLEAGLDRLVRLSARILPSGRIFRTTVPTDGKDDLAGYDTVQMAGTGLRIRVESLLKNLENMKKGIPPCESAFREEVAEILCQARQALSSGAVPDIVESQVMIETALGEIQAIIGSGAWEGVKR